MVLYGAINWAVGALVLFGVIHSAGRVARIALGQQFTHLPLTGRTVMPLWEV